MSALLRFDVAKHPITQRHSEQPKHFSGDQITSFNHRHRQVLSNYDLMLAKASLLPISEHPNAHSNLGPVRNRQLRESVILAAALSAVAVGLRGRGSLTGIPSAKVTSALKNALKRANDRTAAQVMSEVLQTTTESLSLGEEILIESRITEGVRVKPGYEAGGNPTIGVGMLFGKPEHRAMYGSGVPNNITLLSMGNDVIDGTTKSIQGIHSSLTALFITASDIKRHLPDIYVQRWMSGVPFELFNPLDVDLMESARIIARGYGLSGPDQLSAFFLDRTRHLSAMDILNEHGVVTPFDKDGDLFPGVVLGLEDFCFPNDYRLHAMVGDIGGSAEWAVGVLPLIWRGGQAIGMLTSQSNLTRKGVDPVDLWNNRFNFTEEEQIMIDDARFQHKPVFTIHDILADPFAGGISAFGAITDNIYLPFMTGVEIFPEENAISVNVLVVNSLGIMECWKMTFQCRQNLEHTSSQMSSPKNLLAELRGSDLENAIGNILGDTRLRERFRICFRNEYYPAIIPSRGRIRLLPQSIDTLIERGALNEQDRAIINITHRLAPEWFFD